MPKVSITMKATIAAMTAIASDPATSHAAPPTMSGADRRPDRPAEDAPQDAADHRHDDEQEDEDRVERDAAGLALRRLHGRRVRRAARPC